MGPSLKKRKIIDGNASRLAFHQSIGAFAKVTKSGVVEQSKKEKALAAKVAHDSDSELEHKKPWRKPNPTESKKRRREGDLEATRTGLDDRSINITDAPTRPDLKKQSSEDAALSTPVKRRKKSKVVSKEVATDTPTKGARAFLESFVISTPQGNRSSSPALPSSSPLPAPSNSTHASKDQVQLTAETQDLIDLHNAFLNAISLHYAHNGSSSPADIRILIPSIERRWGKWRITADDIRSILGIQQYGLAPTDVGRYLSLVDYGRGKVCIEYSAPADLTFPVGTLRNIFYFSIRKLATSDQALPLAPITPFESEEQRPSKGAQRLAEIRARPAKAQTTSASTASFRDAVSTPSSKPNNRAASLIDRIRMKEAHAASLPAPPSAEALARRAALMRLEEIIPVLEILSGSSSTSVASQNLYSRSSSQASLDALMKPSLSSLGASLGIGPTPPAKVVSFTLANVVQHLQNSLKHPIAREEAERCVRLLASEVASRWVGIREVGKVVGITFRGNIGRAEWMGKLKELVDSA